MDCFILRLHKKCKNFASKNSVWKEERKKRSFFDAKNGCLHNLRFDAAFLTPAFLTLNRCLHNLRFAAAFLPQLFWRKIGCLHNLRFAAAFLTRQNLKFLGRGTFGVKTFASFPETWENNRILVQKFYHGGFRWCWFWWCWFLFSNCVIITRIYWNELKNEVLKIWRKRCLHKKRKASKKLRQKSCVFAASPGCLHKISVKNAGVKKAAAKTQVLCKHFWLASKTQLFCRSFFDALRFLCKRSIR